MTNTVTIYTINMYQAFRMDETGTGYSLEPAGSGTIHYASEDDGGVAYILPENVSVAKNETALMLWDDKIDAHIDLVKHPATGKPALVGLHHDYVELVRA